MKIQTFDELNSLGLNRRSIPYEEFFSVMNLPKSELQIRLSMASDIYELMIVHFLLFIDSQNYKVSKEFLVNQLKADMLDMASKYVQIDDYVELMVNSLANDITTSTIGNYDVPYYLSEDRAMYIAEDNANAFCNYKQYQDATQSKSTKTWHTAKDLVVRKTHREVDEKQIPIDEFFNVGGSRMRFPKDMLESPSPEEIIGCRCWVTYK